MILDKGQFLVLTGEIGDIIYAAPNSLVSAMTRHDTDERFGATYGVPFSTLAGVANTELPDQLASVVFTIHGEYFREFSTLMNYQYTNIRADGMLSKHWGF